MVLELVYTSAEWRGSVIKRTNRKENRVKNTRLFQCHCDKINLNFCFVVVHHTLICI